MKQEHRQARALRVATITPPNCESWPAEAAMKDFAETLAEEIRDSLDAILAGPVDKASCDALEEAGEWLRDIRPRRLDPTLVAARVISKTLGKLGSEAPQDEVARTCISHLANADLRFGSLGVADVLGVLACFDPSPPTAAAKGKCGLAGVIVALADLVHGALDLPPSPPAEKGHQRRLKWRKAAVDRVQRRLARTAR